ncbi:Anaphase promoting complex subunit 7 [Rhizoclosmatium sp. JEL0117]|nr:Anaphase promoting complex subunit 7 [Rhizoclosmatium sp. JEL0117]
MQTNTLPSDRTTLLEHAQRLLASGNALSALSLARAAAAAAAGVESESQVEVEVEVVLAAALVQTRDFSAALSLLKRTKQIDAKVAELRLVAALELANSMSFEDVELDDALKRAKMCARKPLSLLRLMVTASLKLGKLKDAQNALWEVLVLEPYSIHEAKLLVSKCNIAPSQELSLTLNAIQSVQNWDFEEAKRLLGSSTNIETMLQLATYHVKEGDYAEAKTLFQLIRQRDPYFIKGMDLYARILQRDAPPLELNIFATTLLSIAPHAPEPWVAMARYCESKQDWDRAMHLVDKSLSLDSAHVEGYLLKGTLYLSLAKSHEAVSSFRQAHTLSPSYESYRGLMESYIASKRTAEALATAKEAMQRMKENARAIVLVGVVLSHIPGRQPQARLAFQKALTLDPRCTEAIFALASSYSSEQNHRAAAQFLTKSLLHINNHVIHTRLGDVYAVMKEYEVAMEHYNIALKMAPEYEGAVGGFGRVEKLIDVDRNGEEGEGGSVMEEEEMGDDANEGDF